MSLSPSFNAMDSLLDGCQLLFILQDQAQPSQSNVGVDLSRSGSYDHARQLASESHFKGFSTTGSESRYL